MVEYTVAMTDEPWTLPIDALVVSVGSGFGELAAAVDAEFPAARLEYSGFENAAPNRPVLRELRPQGTSGVGPWLAVLATPHSDSDFLVTLDAIVEATGGAVRAATQRRALRIGLPMLATGTLGRPYAQVADAAVPAAMRAAGEGAREVVFFAPFEREAMILRDVVFTQLGHLPKLVGVDAPDALDGQEAGLAGGVSSDFVDPRIGIAPSRDRLGITPYVSMLATVIVDPKTEVPLSVGIFGEWGSGKSFFMGLLREQINRLAPRVAQISFNAWHYADTNIWASLGDEIFRQLIGPDPSDADRRHDLREALNRRLDQRREYEAMTAHASAAAAEVRDKADRAAADRAARVRDLLRALRGSSDLRRRANTLWRLLGVGDEAEQVRLLADQLHGSLTEVDALRRSWSARAGRLALAAAATILVSFALLAVASPQVRNWTAGCAVTVAGLCGVGAMLLERARSGLRALRLFAEELRIGLREANSSAATPEVIKALSSLREAEAAQRVAEAQLDEVVAHIGALGRQLAELDPGRRLYSFLAERVESSTYASRLGLISTIRKDFEELVVLLADARSYMGIGKWESDSGQRVQAIERIVLYIDDLDRCSPRQVSEVLQAVHLLLALDLFVVVLGVDPRWLRSSLRSHYQGLLDQSSGDSGPIGNGRATPEDYLEKIINIPVSLPRMPNGAFGLMASGLAGSPQPGAPAQTSSEADADAYSDPDLVEGGPARSAIEASGHAAAGGLTVERGSAIARQRTRVNSSAELRPLSEAESVLLGRLGNFTRTPREAKRLINLYRMLRSTRDLSGSSRFLGEDGEPGEYQAVIVLLGILSFRPHVLDLVLDAPSEPAADIKGGLLLRDASSSWVQFIVDLRPQDGRNAALGQLPPGSVADWHRLYLSLVELSVGLDLSDLSVYQRWAKHVRRFSFGVHPLAATKQ